MALRNQDNINIVLLTRLSTKRQTTTRSGSDNRLRCELREWKRTKTVARTWPDSIFKTDLLLRSAGIPTGPPPAEICWSFVIQIVFIWGSFISKDFNFNTCVPCLHFAGLTARVIIKYSKHNSPSRKPPNLRKVQLNIPIVFTAAAQLSKRNSTKKNLTSFLNQSEADGSLSIAGISRECLGMLRNQSKIDCKDKIFLHFKLLISPIIMWSTWGVER